MDLRSTIAMIVALMVGSYGALYSGGYMIGIGGLAVSVLCVIIILVQLVSIKNVMGEYSIDLKRYAWLSIPLLFIEMSIAKHCYTVFKNLPYINNMTMPKSWYTYASITNFILFIKIILIYLLLSCVLNGTSTIKYVIGLYVIALLLSIFIGICSTIAFSFRTDG